MKCAKTFLIVILGSLLFLSLVIAGEKGKEISDHPKKISCLFQGLVERNGQTEVDLIFINKTGRDIKNVFGGFRIFDKKGEVIQRCGFTYGRPFEKGKKLKLSAFRYLSLKEPSRKALELNEKKPPMVFKLGEIEYKDGKKETFDD